MANKASKEPKGNLYSKELETARLRGDWDGDVSISGGARLPWTELIRKYMKHNPHEQVVPSVASLEHQIRSTLSAFYKQEDFGDASYEEDAATLKASGQTTFPPAVPLDQFGTGWSGERIGEAIKQLSSLRSAAKDPLTAQSIAALEAYAYFTLGQDENAVELLHEVRFLEDVDLDSLKAGKYNEDYIVALIMMGYTVYGMANERLFYKQGDQGYVPFAYAGFTCTIDLHETIRGGKSANALRGLPADEIERWGEVALYRNALLSVRQGNTTLAINAVRAYQAHAGRWPANFREPQRIVIYRTYLRLLNQSSEAGTYSLPPTNVTTTRDDCRSAAYQTSVVATSASRVELRDFESERASRQQSSLRAGMISSKGLGGATSRTTSTRRPAAYRGVLPSGPSAWSNEFSTVQKAASDSIARSSHFPRAGHVNVPALELADEITRGWRLNGERGGDWADEVVEFLYLLSRVTFLSQRVTRHLFTLLVASENYEEARRALHLYMQIVDKAREGDAAEASGLVEESKNREQGGATPTNGAMTEHSKQQTKKALLDSDSDRLYMDTLLYGVHVYTRYMQLPKEADELARKVIAFVDQDRERTLGKDVVLWAKVKRVAGIARGAFCASENKASNRAALQDEALALLKQSNTLDDQSSETWYALAYLQSELLDVNSAIRSARKAVELEPANVEYWHLLCLLVSAQKDFRGALRIAEEGLAEAEDDDEADQTGGNKEALLNGTNGSAVERSAGSRTLLLSVDYPPRGTERAESILRLMITHNALEEIVEGGQAAMEGQREIFEFFHRRIGTNVKAQGSRLRTVSAGLNGASTQKESNNLGSVAGSPRNPTSTVLGGSQQAHSRFHSLTGMGQSGSLHHLLPHLHLSLHGHGGKEEDGSPSVGVPALAKDDDLDEQAKAASIGQTRGLLHDKQQTALLSSLWLMSAATFRRNGKLSECRVAIQEAERVDPGEAEVWLQLALWFEQQPEEQADQPSTTLAMQCLYKALACKGDHVGATVHLARLFLANPSDTSIRNVQDAVADVASPVPQTTDNIHPSPLASELLAHTQSRRISASSAVPHAPATSQGQKQTEVGAKSQSGVEQDSSATAERRRLAAVSLAEGLLVNLTQSNGWNVPEAWLFLARVFKENKSLQKQRECLEYALQLEKTKTIRALPIAVKRV